MAAPSRALGPRVCNPWIPQLLGLRDVMRKCAANAIVEIYATDKYFVCADYSFVRFMTDEESVSWTRKRSPLAHISRAARRISHERSEYIAIT
ncbi:MAG: hypothetical protein IJB92_04825, partial [Clostridia bacterium]|nr:hypothetical protein [Clostridia bacterium]